MNKIMNFNKTTTTLEQSTASSYATTLIGGSRSPKLPNYPGYSFSSSFSSFLPTPMVLSKPYTYEMTPFVQFGHPQDDMAYSDEQDEQYRESPPLEPELKYMESIALFDKAVMPMDGIADSTLDSSPFVSPAVDVSTDRDRPSHETEALKHPPHALPGPEHANIPDSSDPARTTKRANVDEWGDNFIRRGKRQRQDINASTAIDCPPKKMPFHVKIAGRVECGCRTSIG